MPSIKSKFYRLAGNQIRYLESGSLQKPSLVLLHAWPATADMYRPIIRNLSSSFHILAPDFPGFGLSHSTGESSYASYTKFISNFLINQNLSRVYLCGSSMGAAIALNFTHQHPDKVKKMVIHAPPINLGIYHQQLYPLLARLTKHSSLTTPIINILKGHPCRVYFYLRDRKYHLSFSLVDQIYSTAKHSSPNSIMSLLAEFVTKDITDLAESISVPTRLLIGQNDHQVLQSDAQKICHLNKNFSLLSIPEVNHRFSICAPHRFAQAVSKFILS